MIVVVSAFIIRDGRALLTQRREGKQCAFLWETPGGKLEPDESEEVGLHRELKEEIGVRIGMPDEQPIVIEFPEGEIRHKLKPFVLKTYVVTAYEGTPTPCEGQGIGWFTVAELRWLPLAPGNHLTRQELIDALEARLA